MMTAWLNVLRALKIAALLFPWSAACFAAGLLLGVVWGNRAVVQQFKERLEEARVRQEVLAGAVQLLTRDKFQAHAASVESLRRLRVADDKPKGQDGISPLGVLAQRQPDDANGKDLTARGGPVQYPGGQAASDPPGRK